HISSVLCPGKRRTFGSPALAASPSRSADLPVGSADLSAGRQVGCRPTGRLRVRTAIFYFVDFGSLGFSAVSGAGTTAGRYHGRRSAGLIATNGLPVERMSAPAYGVFGRLLTTTRAPRARW